VVSSRTAPARSTRFARPDAARIGPRDPRYLDVLDFLTREAELLDHALFGDWVDLLADDLQYRMPVRVTRAHGDGEGFEEYYYFDEDHASIRYRVKRLVDTGSAWSEDPPPRPRRFVTNISVYETPVAGEYHVASYLLFVRSRLDNAYSELLSAEREDLVRADGDSFKLARRTIYADQATLGSPNLSVFL
jgi:3-phenylpropionate/cinnamic acid dioxygenase small subunit